MEGYGRRAESRNDGGLDHYMCLYVTCQHGQLASSCVTTPVFQYSSMVTFSSLQCQAASESMPNTQVRPCEIICSPLL